MKNKKWIISLFAIVMLQLIIALPLFAEGDNDYNISDIALTPGADASQLNITWHTDDAMVGDTCSVKIGKRLFSFFPPRYRTFSGTWADAGTDEYGNEDYYCKVCVTDLKKTGRYTYRLSDGNNNWSDSFHYTSMRHKKYGFFFLTDSQIGASGPKDLSRSRDVKPYIEEYYETNDLPDGYTVDDIYDLFENEYTEEGRTTDLADLAYVDPYLAGEILDLIAERIDEQMEASLDDTEGWATTVELMTDTFPRASFIISAGDQVELKDAEWEYTGFFTPYELTSIPVAPTYASHDRALNFEYHFSLPNESEEYGVDSNGVGDYYFTRGNALFMVLNMDVTNGLFPRGAPPPPPGGGGPGGPPTDTDGDGVSDDDDLCPDTPEGTFVDEDGCPLPDGEDYDGDGVDNEYDQCSNTPEGYDVNANGCPYFDVDEDGIPDEIDRCNNTYGDLTVDEEGCADCDYIETEDELLAWLEELQNSCTTDPDTGITTCEDTLADFKASLEEHQAFMEDAIDANPQANWKIVVWHYSIYSAAMHSTDDQSEGTRYLFTPMLDDLDIDVVLMGHDHAYTKTYQMLGNEPQTEQIVRPSGKVINPTGTLYLTASSSSGSKYYNLNCNIGDESSDSSVYYEYADVFYEDIPTFTYFEIDDNTLKFESYTYSIVEDEDAGVAEYVPVLIDEYAMEKKPPRWKKGWWWRR